MVTFLLAAYVCAEQRDIFNNSLSLFFKTGRQKLVEILHQVEQAEQVRKQRNRTPRLPLAPSISPPRLSSPLPKDRNWRR